MFDSMGRGAPSVMRNRSLFWPTILILTGVIALAAETGVISTGRLDRLAELWPVVLIVIGLELVSSRVLQGSNRELAAVLIVLVAFGGAVAYVTVRGPVAESTQISVATQKLDSSDTVGSVNQATLDVNAGEATMTVEGSNTLGSDLYRAHIEYTGSKPQVSLDRSTGTLRIVQHEDAGFFASRRFVLDMQINAAVPWNISADTGSAIGTLNLSAVKVGAIRLNTGASRTDITLGRPTGLVRINVDGGAITLHLHRPNQSEAFVHVSGGEASLNADGRQLGGIGDKSWQSNGYDGAADAFRVDVNGGASTVTVDTSTT